MTTRTAAKPRIAVITNGNYFANTVLLPLLEHPDREYLVLVTTGLRNQGRGKFRESARLLATWGVRYSAYKIAVSILPLVAQRLGASSLTVAATCNRLGLPIRRERDVNGPNGRAVVEAFRPDLLVSVSCPYRISPDILAMPSVGAINVHSSMLPRYAGVSTYIHVLAEGEGETGMTIHEMVEKFDAGRILAQEAVPVPESTTAFRLFTAQCAAGARLLNQTVDDALRHRRLGGVDQDLSKRSYRNDPRPADVAALRRRGHQLISFRDLLNLA